MDPPLKAHLEGLASPTPAGHPDRIHQTGMANRRAAWIEQEGLG
jgi:hypothetical protein